MIIKDKRMKVNKRRERMKWRFIGILTMQAVHKILMTLMKMKKMIFQRKSLKNVLDVARKGTLQRIAIWRLEWPACFVWETIIIQNAQINYVSVVIKLDTFLNNAKQMERNVIDVGKLDILKKIVEPLSCLTIPL